MCLIVFGGLFPGSKIIFTISERCPNLGSPSLSTVELMILAKATTLQVHLNSVIQNISLPSSMKKYRQKMRQAKSYISQTSTANLHLEFES